MSFLKPPAGFIALERASNTQNRPYDTIGVCVDYFEPTKSRGTDYTIQFVLHDPTWIRDRGLRFRFFSSSIEKLPCIQSNGDVLILRNVMTKSYNGEFIGMSNYTTSWVVLSGSTIQESTCPNGSDISFKTSSTGLTIVPEPTTEELKYIKEIVQLEDPTNYKPPPRATALQVESIMKEAGGTASPRKDKWKPIKDLTVQPGTSRLNFADLFGEVRKLWYSDFGRVEVSLTDYTTNKLLFSYSEDSQSRDGDTYGYAGASHARWPGPWGRMTIVVTLFDIHAEFAKSQIKPGMYILVKNCQIKLDDKKSKLEAVCRGDRDYASKVNIAIFQPHKAESDSRLKEVLERRAAYEKDARARGLRFRLDNEPEKDGQKRIIDNIDGGDRGNQAETEGSKTLSKSSKRKRRKNKQNTEVTGDESTKVVIQSNQYVRCENIDVPLKSIDDILDSTILQRKTPEGNNFSVPFQNCSYKCKVRVVDFWPNNLEDFSVPYLISNHDTTPALDNTQSTDLALLASQTNPHTVRWEWRFFLVVEDAGPRPPTPDFKPQQMAVLVADLDGEYLLRHEATDLRANPQDLAKLREGLFVLWGDLQEQKEEGKGRQGESVDVKSRSKPFECFIKEYGVPVPSNGAGGGINGQMDVVYQRMFRLFGTSI